jgi:glycerol-3-phosphate dehydrogenase (NAD(P)+)
MNIKTDKVAVIGSGSWATAISKMLLENVGEINWFFRKTDTIALFKKRSIIPVICVTLNSTHRALNFTTI